MKIGIFAGSFDPLTNGHLDIIKRAKHICDKIIVAIGLNSAKKSLFSVDERLEMLERSCCYDNNDKNKIEFAAFEGLLVDYCKKRGVSFIIRSLRSALDFEYEYPIAIMNGKLVPEIETIFLISKNEFSFISSNIVKEVASYGGEIATLVPPFVNTKLTEKFSN